MERWISRFSMTFVILAGLLAWQAYKGATGRLGPVPGWWVYAYMFGAAASFSLGMLGVRIRHRKNRY